LASGLLTGKVRARAGAPAGSRLADTPGLARMLSDRNLETIEALLAFATGRGHGLLELAMSWLLAHGPVASVIAGATSAEQVRGNARAAGWALSAADLAQIDGIAPLQP
jgi:aryl-alcohol dehydrogenase-like predicted oxidoreductase